MNQLAEGLARVAGALKMSHEMLARVPWYRFKSRWHLQGAHDMLEAMYEMLYQLMIEASTIKAKEDRANEQHDSN